MANPLYTITKNDINNLVAKNVTMKNGDENIVEGSKIYENDNLVAKTNQGYIFISMTFDWLNEAGSSKTDYFDISTDKQTANLKIIKHPKFYKFTRLNVNTKLENPILYKISNSDYTNMTENKVTMTRNGINVIEGTEIYKDDLLLAVTTEDREFYISSSYPNSSVYFVYRDSLGGEHYKEFIISEDNKQANYKVEELNDDNKYTSFISLTKQTSVVTGNNNIYLIDKKILTELNTERFVRINDSFYDYGQYILGLLQLPFKIDDSLILEKEPIILANLKTKVEANRISTDKIKVDLGDIEIIGKENNLLDYSYTTAILHLPRVDSINIDLEYVINQTISIIYIIDCYNGSATINIYSSKISDVIVTKKVDIGVNIPFANLVTNTTTDNNNIMVGGDNGITKPFIEIVKSNFIIPDGFFTIPIIDEDMLYNQNGYIEVDDIELKNSINKIEYDDILSILKNGIIIKNSR